MPQSKFEVIAIKGGIEYDREGPALSKHDVAYGTLRGRKFDLLYLVGLDQMQAMAIADMIMPMLKEEAKVMIVKEKNGSCTVQFNMEVKPPTSCYRSNSKRYKE